MLFFLGGTEGVNVQKDTVGCVGNCTTLTWANKVNVKMSVVMERSRLAMKRKPSGCF